jgi:acetoin utilization deacetylase AcuC-like enzyme
MAIEVVWTERHRLHRPTARAHLGALEPAQEVAERADVVRDALVADPDVQLHPPDEPADELAAIRAVHDDGLVELLRTVVERWRAAELPLDRPAIVPWAFPQGRTRASPPAVDVRARLGERCTDTITVVLEGTWEAAVAAAHSAVTAARLVVDGAPLSFAAVRPPGHHAGPAWYGGSCFLNNAAIAAEWLVGRGRRVAIVDVDAHHGQGTQEIFYERGDVFYGSVHVDPAFEYPYWFGFAEEQGLGPGLGSNRNVPLPPGTTDSEWLAALGSLAGDVDGFAPEVVVVSLGVDGLAEDSNSDLLLTPAAFVEAGRLLGRLGVPLVCVLEGGYVLEQVGPTVLGFLHAARPRSERTSARL